MPMHRPDDTTTPLREVGRGRRLRVGAWKVAGDLPASFR